MKTLRTLTLIALSLTLLSCEKEEETCNCGFAPPILRIDGSTNQDVRSVYNDCTGNRKEFPVTDGYDNYTDEGGHKWCHNDPDYIW